MARRAGIRTHHIHVIEGGFIRHWERLLFRDHLIAHPDVARAFADLKTRLAMAQPSDCVAYTSKSDFIAGIMAVIRQTSLSTLAHHCIHISMACNPCR